MRPGSDVSRQVSLGKFGTFSTNHLIGRPFHLTYEINVAACLAEGRSNLQIVPAAELHAHIQDGVPSEFDVSTPAANGAVTEIELVGPDGDVVMRGTADGLTDGSARGNADVTDDPGSQTLTMAEIELLKKQDTGAGHDVVAKILASHTALGKKTAFSLAKYTLRKTRKYLRRFVPLPLDVALLAHITLHERDGARSLELREEVLALAMSWSNVHCGYAELRDGPDSGAESAEDSEDANRWLVIDETGGLVVAAMAERMGILHPGPDAAAPAANGHADAAAEPESPTRPHRRHADEVAQTARHNTLTLVHANAQPNLSMLPYFAYSPTNPAASHPLHAHLKTLTWLQLLHPEEDSFCTEVPPVPAEELASWKGGKRSAYHRKRRRAQRTVAVSDDARAGGFAGLVVASVMEPTSVLRHLLPLLRGGAQVVVYAANLEPLVALQDACSMARRAAFIALSDEERIGALGTDDFPVDPTLLLATAIHSVRARPWQVLPGRTHPVMTDRGGAEGYVFVATRVTPVDGVVHARGTYERKKRRTAEANGNQGEGSPWTQDAFAAADGG